MQTHPYLDLRDFAFSCYETSQGDISPVLGPKRLMVEHAISGWFPERLVDAGLNVPASRCAQADSAGPFLLWH